jgi:hypothetical protein
MFYKKKQTMLRGLLGHTPNPQAGGPIADFCERFRVPAAQSYFDNSKIVNYSQAQSILIIIIIIILYINNDNTQLLYYIVKTFLFCFSDVIGFSCSLLVRPERLPLVTQRTEADRHGTNITTRKCNNKQSKTVSRNTLLNRLEERG